MGHPQGITRTWFTKKFDKQVEKMRHQEKHMYKDTRQIWEYALAKVKGE